MGCGCSKLTPGLPAAAAEGGRYVVTTAAGDEVGFETYQAAAAYRRRHGGTIRAR